VTEVLADAGYLSTSNIEACERHQLTPYISIGRERRAGGLERFREPPPLRENTTARERLCHRLRTKDDKVIYGQRKVTIEPRSATSRAFMAFGSFRRAATKKYPANGNLLEQPTTLNECMHCPEKR
jgi:hypothetical protein